MGAAIQDVLASVSFEEDLSKKQQLLAKVALVFAIILAAYTSLIFVLMPGFTPAKGVAVIASLSLFAISWLSHFPSLYRTCAIGVVVITLVCGFGASLSNDGVEGYVAPILITTPIFAALFLGSRATLYSALSVVFVFALLHFMRESALIKETAYSADVVSIATVVLLTTATAICASGLGYFASASERQIESLKKAQRSLIELASELNHSANHDALTGIANRAHLNMHLKSILEAPEAQESRICVIHVDLDKFKAVNDNFGHPVGDTVLKNAAQILSRYAENAHVARVGGDEFVIVLTPEPNVNADALQTLCDKIVARISRPMLINGIECQIGASIGFVISDTLCASVETLIQNADIALYEAKRAGRGVAIQFTANMRDQIERKRHLTDDLKAALIEDRVLCALQPQLCLNSGKVLGIEALARIRSHTGHLLSPAQFLPIYEEANLLTHLDDLVISQALDALIELRKSGHDIPSISVNASANSLRDVQYVDRVRSALEHRALTPDDLVIEVLESVFIEDSDDIAAQTIAKLHDFGIAAVMDDFGSGHASMASLLQLQVSGIKLDGSLVNDIENERCQQIMKAALSLSSGMTIPTVAEGIETSIQHKLLQNLGCEAGQGYGLCKPKTTADLDAWLNAYGRSEVIKLQDRIQAANA